MDFKQCNTCDIEKELNKFAIRSQRCKDCANKQKRDTRAENKKVKPILTDKVCNNCNIKKNLSEYSGRSNLCKLCMNERYNLNKLKKTEEKVNEVEE